jgi:hypothetical protein
MQRQNYTSQSQLIFGSVGTRLEKKSLTFLIWSSVKILNLVCCCKCTEYQCENKCGVNILSPDKIAGEMLLFSDSFSVLYYFVFVNYIAVCGV